jgi:hypothetical protein
VYVSGAIRRMTAGERPTTSVTTAPSHAGRRRATKTNAPDAIARLAAAATGATAAILKVDTPNRPASVRTTTGNPAARLSSVLVGGGSASGTPPSPRSAANAACPR